MTGIGNAAAPPSLKGLVAQIREDLAANNTRLAVLRPGFHAVVVYRFGHWLRTLPRPLRLPLAAVHAVLYWVVRMLYQIELPAQAEVGRRFVVAHQGGVVVSHYARIGDDCLLRHNITIGGRRGARDAPSLGNRVRIAPGAVVIGPITVGDDVLIGPNAVVDADIPAGARVFAPSGEIRED